MVDHLMYLRYLRSPSWPLWNGTQQQTSKAQGHRQGAIVEIFSTYWYLSPGRKLSHKLLVFNVTSKENGKEITWKEGLTRDQTLRDSLRSYQVTTRINEGCKMVLSDSKITIPACWKPETLQSQSKCCPYVIEGDRKYMEIQDWMAEEKVKASRLEDHAQIPFKTSLCEVPWPPVTPSRSRLSWL